MNLIQVEDGHFRNMDAYQIDYKAYKGIGRPLRTDYKVKQLVKQRKTRIKKASVTSTGIDYKTPALIFSYLFFMWIVTTLKGL